MLTRWGARMSAGALLCLLPVLAVPAQTGSAQNQAVAYRQTVIAIQQKIEANDLDGARALITTATQQFRADGGLDNLLGVVEIQQGHTDRAKQAFSAAIRHNPRLVGAYLNLSRIYLQTAATDAAARAAALRLSEKAALLAPDNDEAHYQAATLLTWEEKHQRSLDHLARLSAEARMQVGAEALYCADEAGLQHNEAASRNAVLLAANPGLTEQDAMTCLPALRTAHRADLIETLFAAAASRHPLSAAGLRILGLAQEAEGKLEPARATLEQAFAADSTATIVLVDLTRVAKAAKDYQGALGYLAHARELAPADASLPYEFGVICLKMGLLGEARKAMEQAIKLAPENPEYNLGMGTVLSFSHDPSEALPFLDKYHALRPADSAGTLTLGTTYFRMKDYDSASKWLNQAAASETASAEAHYYLGRIARQEGKLDEAVVQLTQSAALKPDQPEVLAELGQVDLQLKKYAEAEKLLDRAFALDADSYPGNFGLLQLYARTGDSRREEQSKRFDAIKGKSEEQYREMMRVIEIQPQGKPEK
ncbi:MAG: tetratricopeptide repeat protein [Terracidiphilus sp.]|nr:tetratricopeptide repeat protein [Terracidiphilus sp.]